MPTLLRSTRNVTGRNMAIALAEGFRAMTILRRGGVKEEDVKARSDRGQSAASFNANASYFLNNIEQYRSLVSTTDTHKRINDFISQKLSGVGELIDIGNGGVFDYDTSLVTSITAVDLFLADLPPELLQKYFPANARARQGSALAIPEPDGQFDMALMVMLLHHLAGGDWLTSWHNAQRAIDEAWRVLRPNGRLLIVESCVPWWFFQIEKPSFLILSKLAKSVLSHPITFQFPVELIADHLRKRSRHVTTQQIAKGKYVLQFGFKIPSIFTPIQVWGIEAYKSE
jgi:SAM-dependent methyltransferase